MSISTRNAIIVVGIIFTAIAVFDPNFFMLRILGTIQSISFIILAWVGIAYMLDRMKAEK